MLLRHFLQKLPLCAALQALLCDLLNYHKIFSLLGLLLSVIATPAFANLTGAQLLQHCHVTVAEKNAVPTTEMSTFCQGYLSGYLDAYQILSKLDEPNDIDIGLICLLPEGISYQKILDSILEYMEANPRTAQLSARILIFQSLVKKYPCKKPELGSSGPETNLEASPEPSPGPSSEPGSETPPPSTP